MIKCLIYLYIFKLFFQKKENPGSDSEFIPNEIIQKLEELNLTDLKALFYYIYIYFLIIQSLTINTLKLLQKNIDEKITETRIFVENIEKKRDAKLVQVGNIIHKSVPISNDEADNEIVRTFGDTTIIKKYSHVFIL